MGKSLIITEKPSVAREFAGVLQVKGSQKGFIEDDRYVITWCVGHLVGLVYPEEYDERLKKWRLEDLPFLPETYKYNVIDSVKDQYAVVHKMLQRKDIDRVYWAGDAGKEGQTIEENIRNFGGVRKGMEELRVWIDSQTQEEILRGIREAKPMAAYENLGKSGIMRTIEDYAMGINFSRVMSVKYARMLNEAAGTKSYTAIAVGRVMTCVLGMVVEREREIRNFKETPFYRIVGNFTDAQIDAEWRAVEGSEYYQSPRLYKENGFREEKDAQALIDSLAGKPATVLALEKSISRRKAPLLFNLAELQAECSRRFKISPDETLQVAQDLYEKKLTTYPRTDARVLSTAVAKEISKNIRGIGKYGPTAAFAQKILEDGLYKNIARTQYTDDSKVTDHYAIIPTGQLTELNSLSSLERNVFDVIVRRFLSIFYPPAEYTNVKMTVGVGKEKFFASAKVLKTPGYLEIAGIPKKKEAGTENDPASAAESGNGKDSRKGEGTEDSEVSNPQALLELAEKLKKKDPVSVNGYEIRYGKTQPPKRYTSGSMILAMENAGQLIEDEELRAQIKGSGIGTSATRAEIISKLVRIHYLALNKKTQVLTPEQLGEMVYEVVALTVPAMLNPKMTASWEKGLDGITQGTVEYMDYRRKLEDYIRRETVKMIGEDIKTPLAGKISEFTHAPVGGVKTPIGVKCPACGGELITTPFGFGCSNYKADKTGCNFVIGKMCDHEFTPEEVRQLMTEGHTPTIRGFKSRAGKRFNAVIILKKDDKGAPSLAFDFDHVEDEILPDLVCPACGSPIRKTSYGFTCTKYNRDDPKGCSFSLGQICGKTLTAKNLKELLSEEHKTEQIKGFKSKAGKRFDAALVLKKDEKGKISLGFDFDAKPASLEGLKCPICGGEIKKTAFGYGCANYNKEDPASCRFLVGKIAGKTLSDANISQLLGPEGRTETIRGFKSKTGKRFDGRLALARDEQGKVTGIKFDFDDVKPQELKDVKCPKCGSPIIITRYGYSCMKNQPAAEGEQKACDFHIGTIASVKLKPAQAIELLTRGKTGIIEGFVAKTGMKFDAALKLDPDKKVVFDFPEKTEPAESQVPCPKCHQLMKKGPRQYECSCGCKFWYTVGKVELPEEVILELATTGKSKEKITGFTSKAGKFFDAYLKFEDGQIRYDFERQEVLTPDAAASAKAARREAGKVDFAKITEDETASILADIEALRDGNEEIGEMDHPHSPADGSEKGSPQKAKTREDIQNRAVDPDGGGLQDDDLFAMYAGMDDGGMADDITDDMLAMAHQND